MPAYFYFTTLQASKKHFFEANKNIIARLLKQSGGKRNKRELATGYAGLELDGERFWLKICVTKCRRTINNDAMNEKRYEKIAAWELVNQKITYKDSAGIPVSGTITVKNITASTDKKYFFYGTPYEDERQFTLSNGEVIVPSYKGHTYETILSFNVEGGNPIKYQTQGVPVAKGKLATYDNFSSPALTDIAPDSSETVFIVDRPTSPYNLTSEAAIDIFTLSWDWVNSEGFIATNFKVFRGPTEIANVTVQSAANIPLDSPDGISSYTVIAYDASGNASTTSSALIVVPSDQTPLAAYFTWMQSYFGEQLMYSCDDPDGDGVNNYQEFINGTDPTKLLGPAVSLKQKTYTKIALQWQPVLPDETGISYKIFRNDVEIGNTTSHSFLDTGLTPGITFAYKVKAIRENAQDSEFSTTLSFRTMSPAISTYADELKQVVDMFNPIDATQYTGTSLVSAVKSGLESLLGTNITFTVVNNDIFESFVEEELTLIKAITPALSETERAAAQAELDELLETGFGGHSFEHVYIRSKLAELAEKHWQQGHKAAAKALYECALSYLNDQETYVFASLISLASFELAEMTEDSTNEEITTILNNYRDTYLRFFDFFENSTSQQALTAYRMPTIQYFKKIPVLLKYENYNHDVFNTTLQLAQAAYAIDNSPIYENRRDKIAAWELVNLEVSITKPDGTSTVGTLLVKNVSEELLAGDEREFRIDGSSITVQVYAGHEYDLTASFDVAGGPAIEYTIKALPHEKGKKTIYDPYNETVTQNLPEGATGGEIVFITDQPTSPYNLSSEVSIDVFNLAWNWTNPEGFTATHFKVFRGTTEIANVVTQSADNIPCASPDGISSYTVIAYDANDNASTTSPILVVAPGDQTPLAAYFAWMQSYFGEQLMYSSDDPDGDGVNNYQEFINGTDPTKIPGVTISLKQKTYTKISLQWNPVLPDESGVSYKIFRNDMEVGSTTDTFFTDTGLTSGVSFSYKINAIRQDAPDSEFSNTLSFRTMSPAVSTYANELKQVVDQFNPIDATQYTGTSLVSAVKSGVESLLGTNITFTVVNNDILENFVEEELTLIREITPALSETEQVAAQAELTEFLNDSFGGHSFEHVYIRSKLAELGEKHWQQGHKAAAKALYECALSYLSDQETYVFASLISLASFELAETTENSTKEEVITILNSYRDIYLRFFSFFENSTSQQALTAYRIPAIQYYKNFPLLLKYDDYNQDVFNSALQLAQAAYAIDNDSMNGKRCDKIAAWELMNLEVSITKPDGTPAAGTLLVKNVSEGLFGDAFVDERELRIDDASVTAPAYVGHNYEVTALFDVVGGPAMQYTVKTFSHGKGKKITYNPYSESVTQNLPEGEIGGEIVFIGGQPLTPYNLRSVVLPDVFSLSWDWVAPTSAYQLQHFKVYRGDVEVGTVTQQQMDNIPRILTMDSYYFYTVVAVDINNNHTPVSPALKVLPVFTEEEQEYFDWKTKYFGDASMLANEDPDQDGLSNIEEFLLGSNPTVAPQADPKATLTNIIPGIEVSYYAGSFSAMPDFSTRSPYKTDILTTFNMPSNYGSVLTSGREDNVAVVLTAYFDAQVSGKYRFYMVDDDGARLYIDNNLVIDHDRTGWRDGYNDVYLKAGTHSFRLEYYERGSRATLQVKWAGPDFTQKIMDSSALWYTPDDTTILAEVIAWQKDTDLDGVRDIEERNNNTSTSSGDSDGDGLSDYEEINTYNTDPNKVDTDGDGVSDYDEVKIAFTNPLLADFDGTSTTLQTINGSSFASSSSGWEKEGDAVYCAARNGSVTYNLTVPQKGVYVLELTGTEYN
ncbi:MAG: hypothetical protein KOO69_00120, partial [Victivallales bacterium]|nr:hypothetical protein [Victivallales bacterium]